MFRPARPSCRPQRLLLLALPVLFVLGACTGQRTIPDQYGDTTRDNFQEGCVEALTEVPGDEGFEENDTGGAEAFSADDARDICRCSYEDISAEGGIPYEQFREITEEQEDEPAALPDDIQAIVSDCRSEVTSG